MPILYTYECSLSQYREDKSKLNEFIPPKCDFRIKAYGGPHMYLKWNGKEKVLPHPLEDQMAFKITGRKLDELAKEGLIIFKHSKICPRCFKYEGVCTCENTEFIEIPKLEGMTCPKCKKGIIEKHEAGIT